MPSAADVVSILSALPASIQVVQSKLTVELPSLDLGFGHLYGGQVFSQAVLAANYWLAHHAPKLQLHMTQSVFLKAGNAQDPVRFTVQPLGLGRTFQRLEVKAFQGNKLVFQAMASAQKPEAPFLAHELPMPAADDPSTLLSLPELKFKLTGQMPVHEFPIEIRVATPSVFFKAMTVGEKQGVWFRYSDVSSLVSSEDEGQVKALTQALLAYASDYGFLGALFVPHEPSVKASPFFLTSLDHTLWFYSDYNPSAWAYFESESPVAQQGRGLVLGRFFQQNRLLAVASQEGLLRRRN